jgi:hypothetical protein
MKLNKGITEDLSIIREQRLEALQLLTMSNFRTCFSFALRYFNGNKVFDFSSFIRGHELNDSSKWLIQPFTKCCKTFGIEKAAEIVRKQLLWYLFYMQLGVILSFRLVQQHHYMKVGKNFVKLPLSVVLTKPSVQLLHHFYALKEEHLLLLVNVIVKCMDQFISHRKLIL